jgi:hypothetical protein
MRISGGVFHFQRRYRQEICFRQRISGRQFGAAAAGKAETARLSSALRQPVGKRRGDQRCRIAGRFPIRADAKPGAILPRRLGDAADRIAVSCL